MKKINASISISRQSDGKVHIRITDEDAVVEFVDLEMDAASFGKAVTGLSGMKCKARVQHLRNVGKKRERLDAVQRVPIQTLKKLGIESYDSKALEGYLEEHCQREGWTIRPYLGSQTSVEQDGNHVILRFGYVRWVNTIKLK